MIALTPGGRLLDDALASELAAEAELTLLCGRYEGFDERILEHFVTEQVSIGRYVLAGGELAAMVVLDTVLRKLPGVLGDDDVRGRGVVLARRWRARRSTRTTRGPRSGVAGRFPTCCSPATTPAFDEWRREQSRARAQQVRYHDRPPASPILAGLPYAMSTVIDSLERTQLRRVPRFQAGDRVKVHFQVIEGTRRRTQVFEGVVIKRQGEGVRETFTVRKQSFGVGVERTFPLHSPKIEKIEVAARGDVRRAKLYYLRGRVGKRARVRERRYTGPEEVVERGLLYDPAAEAAAAADAEVAGRGRRRAGARRGRSRRDARRPRTPRRRPPVTSRPAKREYQRVAKTTKKGSSSASGSLLELIMIVAVALGPGARHPGLPGQAVPHSERSRWCRRCRSASACWSTASATRFTHARRRRRRGLPPAGGRRAGRTPAAPASRPPARRATSRRAERADVNFIKRIVAGPGDKLRIHDGHVDPQRQARRRSRSPNPAEAARDATSRPRSRFRPGTTS